MTAIEIRAYIGLLLLLSLLKKGDVDVSKIWSTETIHSCYYATTTISRERFQIISACSSFDSLESRQERKQLDNKFYKLKEIFEIFRKKIQLAFVLGRGLCVDECFLVSFYYH